MAFTILVKNSAIGTAHYRGTFETFQEAKESVDLQKSRSQKFMSFEIWRGTPKNPFGPVAPGNAGAILGSFWGGAD